tara:strand:- start:675 stop:962 length:288 start_codon:yes stop_codon:yes gene_type:complete
MKRILVILVFFLSIVYSNAAFARRALICTGVNNDFCEALRPFGGLIAFGISCFFIYTSLPKKVKIGKQTINYPLQFSDLLFAIFFFFVGIGIFVL